MEFDERDLDRLKALRRAAAELRRSSVMQAGGRIGVSMSARIGEAVTVARRGHDEERFRSFMIALRRTYAQNDGAHFLTALNVLAKVCEDRRPQLSNLRASYLAVLNASEVSLFQMTHSDVFEAWLYGSVFHDDDAELREKWQSVAANPLTGAIAKMLVESTALQLAHHVLVLDGVIAEVLGEEPLPPLESHSGPSRVADAPPRALMKVSVRRRAQRGTYRIDFTNVGEGVARDVQLESFVPLNEGAEDVLISGERDRKFPVPKLRTGESVSLMAAPTMGSPSEFEVVVSWSDPDGDRRREDYLIDLFAG